MFADQVDLDHKYIYPPERLASPLQAELDASMAELGILPIIHPEPFYGNPADMPDRGPVFANLEFRVASSATSSLPLFRQGVGQVMYLQTL